MKSTPTPLSGLHHVTAITKNARRNLRFYTEILGLRLVKKTVNQDDVSAYHLFYADAVGTPGTDLTFFEWPSVVTAKIGASEITETGLQVIGNEATLERWSDRLKGYDIQTAEVEDFIGLPSLSFQDHEGQNLRLICTSSPLSEFHPWTRSSVPEDDVIVGLASVQLSVRDPASLQNFLLKVLQFEIHPKHEGFVSTGSAKEVGGLIRIMENHDRGRTGAGGVHHVAWLVDSVSDLGRWDCYLRDHGVTTSGIINRHYFQSLYFRIPEGILFELATIGPGFTADGESVDELGSKLSLPPFLEHRRKEIESKIRPI